MESAHALDPAHAKVASVPHRTMVPHQETELASSSLAKQAVPYEGVERRKHVRTAKTLEIDVQPLNSRLEHVGEPFFAITRDISQGGLSFLCSRKPDFAKAVISLVDGAGPGIVCRVCNHSVIDTTSGTSVILTNVQFMHLYQANR